MATEKLNYKRPASSILEKYGFIETQLSGIFICHFKAGITSMLIFRDGMVTLVDEDDETEGMLADFENMEYLQDADNVKQMIRVCKVHLRNDSDLAFILDRVFE